MRKSFKVTGILHVVLLICLSPHRSISIRACPENLWTNPGQFSHPATTPEVLTWTRNDYGIAWIWLTRDSCDSEAAWYVRVEFRGLILYFAIGLLAAFGMLFIPMRRIGIKPRPQSDIR